MSKVKERVVLCECNVCGQRYENWVGSTPCCGSIAFTLTEIDLRQDKLNKITNRIKYGKIN